MPTSKTVPLHSMTCLIQRIPETLCADVWKNVVLCAMALVDRKAFALVDERRPDLMSQEIPGKLDQACERIVGMEYGVAGEHRPLRKPADDRLLITDRKLS